MLISELGVRSVIEVRFYEIDLNTEHTAIVESVASPRLARLRWAVQAARRSLRWCSPPTSGIAMIRPAAGGWIGRGSGLSFSNAKCVRLR